MNLSVLSVFFKSKFFLVISFIIWTFGLSQLFAQCDPNISIDIDNTSLSIVAGPIDSCTVSFNYTILNSGACDVGVFDYHIQYMTPEGMHSDQLSTSNILLAASSSIQGYSSTSHISFDELNATCYDLVAISTSSSLISTNPPVSMTELIPCQAGFLGDRTVCVNDNAIVCDDSACTAIPQTCDVTLAYSIDESSISLIAAGPNACSVNFDITISNNGACDINTFDVDYSITSPEGNFIYTETFAGPFNSEASSTLNIQASSDLLFDDISTDCFDPMDLSIVAVTSLVNPAEIITTSIGCAMGTGNMDVCANNHAILCDDSNCMPLPETCDPIVDIVIDETSLNLTTTGLDMCVLSFNSTVFNNGGCDLKSFQVDFEITSPEGIAYAFAGINAPFESDGDTSFILNVPSELFYDDLNGVCFDPSSLTLTAQVSSGAPAIPLTELIFCSTGIGYKEVCTNNNNIVCLDTGCSPLQENCETSIDFKLLESTLEVNPGPIDSCTIKFDLAVLNYGACDVKPFGIAIAYLTASGLDTSYHSIPGPFLSNANYIVSVNFASDVFYDSSSGLCHPPSNIISTYLVDDNNLPEVLTTNVDCETGTGFRTVCNNNQNIICDEANCIPIPTTCEVIVDTRINNEELSLFPIGLDSCNLTFPLEVFNNGGCDLDSFDLIVKLQLSDTLIIDSIGISGPLESDGEQVLIYSKSSKSFYSEATAQCIDPMDITITVEMSGTNPAVPITIMTSCDMGSGLMEVCLNNFDIVCDDSNCQALPETCEVNVGSFVPSQFISLSDIGNDSCRMDFTLEVSNNGGCDLNAFLLDVYINGPEGQDSFAVDIPLPFPSDTTIVISAAFASDKLYDEINGVCYFPSQINISTTTNLLQKPIPITMEVACPDGFVGMRRVCVNNLNIICDDMGCTPIPPSCDTDIAYLIDTSSVVLTELIDECNLSFDYIVINRGNCDLNAFDIDLIFDTPLGMTSYNNGISGSFESGDTMFFSFNNQDVVFYSGVDCYDFEEINVSFDHTQNQSPTPIITTVICESGFGVKDVCANNNDIVCDDRCRAMEGSCGTNIQLSIVANSMVVEDVNLNDCKMTADYEITNNGDCDLGSFDLRFRVITTDGNETFVESVPSPILAGTTTTHQISYTSSILKNFMTCFTPPEINLSFTFLTAPLPITISVPCEGEPGNIDVCANDISIECGECDLTVAQDLLSFEANLISDKVKLDWIIENSKDMDRFFVEHRTNEEHFEVIGEVNANTSVSRSNYSFDHWYPESGINYYRIKIIDLNGQASYSNIAPVELEQSEKYKVAPNPTRDYINLLGMDKDDFNTTVSIYNILGQKQELILVKDEKDYRLDVSKLQSGSYILVINNKKTTNALKFIKQ